jgi:hypothetical protein
LAPGATAKLQIVNVRKIDRLWVAGAAALFAVIGMLTPTAAAQAPPASVSGAITDEAGVLSASEERAVQRTLAAGQQQGVDLRVLFVEDTGSSSATAYAEEVARASSMGGDDALLVVAFEARTYALWTADALDVDSREIEEILDTRVAPPLRAGDVPAAVEATVEGLVGAQGDDGSGSRSPSPVGGFSLLPLILLGLTVFLIFRTMRGRARRTSPAGDDRGYEEAPLRKVDVDALAAEANAALVRVDDQLQDAEHETGFAEAQFGADEAAALRAGLEQARTELRQAFALRQQLDDAVPEEPHEQVDLLEQIIQHARAAEEVVAEHLRRIEELRGLERDPVAAAASLRERGERAARRIPLIDAAVAELQVTAAAIAAAVDGNVVEAQKRLAFAEERLEEAAEKAAPDAARALRSAGTAIAQAEQLLDAADDLVERVRRAREELPQELQEAELALARAEDLVRSRRHVVGREARTRVVEARRHYERARALADRDPAVAATEADTAERLADDAFQLGLRDSDRGGDDYTSGGGGFRGFGWGLPIPIPFPFPVGDDGIGWGGTSWGSGGFGGSVGGGSFGGSIGGGSFGGGSAGGGKW